MTRNDFISTLNKWGAEKIPFLFITDFEFNHPQAFPLNSVSPGEILFDVNGFTNSKPSLAIAPEITEKAIITFPEYKARFDVVYDHLAYGDSYLTNLTCPTEVKLSHSLYDFFQGTRARYKLFLKDELVVFSPECFIQIDGGRIFSFPMKGTIDASLPEAQETILKDKKELAEHVTIVDLIRNDLSQVADNVEVTRFRYVERITTKEKDLLQVSSEVTGLLPEDYRKNLGSILGLLLPAGSVSGAPKTKTLQIIREAEIQERGYYTGVFGYFDGERLDSGVMIRFIEHTNGKFYYRSGGGITTQSVAEKEYQELIDKVYVPVA